MKTTEAISTFGSRSKVAEMLGISRAAISRWGDEVPLLRQYQLKEIESKFTGRDLALFRGELPPCMDIDNKPQQ